MSERDLLSERGKQTPDPESEEPSPFRLLTELVEVLETGGVLREMSLAERDLRHASTASPGLNHALDRADQLMKARVKLEQLFHQAKEVADGRESSEVLLQMLGSTAITEVPRR